MLYTPNRPFLSAFANERKMTPRNSFAHAHQAIKSCFKLFLFHFQILGEKAKGKWTRWFNSDNPFIYDEFAPGGDVETLQEASEWQAQTTNKAVAARRVYGYSKMKIEFIKQKIIRCMEFGQTLVPLSIGN